MWVVKKSPNRKIGVHTMRRLLATLTCAALLLISATEPVQARTTSDEAIQVRFLREQPVRGPFQIIALQSVIIQDHPAGCKGKIHHAHRSGGSRADIAYKIAIDECNRYVNYKLEVWGDRHTWSGWRQHTDAHVTKRSRSALNPIVRASKLGRQGTYNYRTRAKGWIFEDSGTYTLGREARTYFSPYRGVYGESIRIHCPGNGGECWKVEG